MKKRFKTVFFLVMFFSISCLYSADRKNILVIMEINDSTGKINKQLLANANDFLRKELVASRNFIIIDKSQQSSAFNELLKKETALTSGKCIEKSCQTIFARSLSADNIFRSTLSQNGKQFMILSELIDVSKESSLSEVSVMFDGTLKDLNIAIKENIEKTIRNYSKRKIVALQSIADYSGKMKKKDVDISNSYIQSEMKNVKKFIVVDKDRQKEGLKKFLKLNKTIKRCNDKNCQIAFSKFLSADYLFYPVVISNGNKFSVSIEVVDVASDSNIAEVSSEFSGRSIELKPLIEDLIEELKDELDLDDDVDNSSDQEGVEASDQNIESKEGLEKITHNRPYFWAGTGVAAGGFVLTIVAIGLDATASKKFDDFKNKTGDPNLRKDGIAMSKAGFAFYTIGGVAMITGVVLALITKENNPPLTVEFDSKKIMIGYNLNF